MVRVITIFDETPLPPPTIMWPPPKRIRSQYKFPTNRRRQRRQRKRSKIATVYSTTYHTQTHEQQQQSELIHSRRDLVSFCVNVVPCHAGLAFRYTEYKCVLWEFGLGACACGRISCVSVSATCGGMRLEETEYYTTHTHTHGECIFLNTHYFQCFAGYDQSGCGLTLIHSVWCTHSNTRNALQCVRSQISARFTRF